MVSASLLSGDKVCFWKSFVPRVDRADFGLPGDLREYAATLGQIQREFAASRSGNRGRHAALASVPDYK
jgi:hypothetical protein